MKWYEVREWHITILTTTDYSDAIEVCQSHCTATHATTHINKCVDCGDDYYEVTMFSCEWED